MARAGQWHKLRFIVGYQIQFCVTVTRSLGREGNVNVAGTTRRQRSRTKALERVVSRLIPGDGEARDIERRQAHILECCSQSRTGVNRVTTET